MRSQGLINQGVEVDDVGQAVPPSGLHAILADIARRRADLTRAFAEAQPSSLEALGALLESLHAEQPGLLAHVRRVSAYAAGIARWMPLPELARQHVERAALVHDVGKLAFPPSLFDKRESFSSEELAVIRTHTVTGADIIGGVPYLRHASAVVSATHERWAGGGFPRGLAGDGIPVAARIIAVADAFDALTGSVAICDDEVRDGANAELVSYAGSHFDPNVVRAWLRASEAVGC